MRTPVALLIFNRPEPTERVFAEIAKAKPPKLLVVADGPRSNRPGEAEKCAAARAIIDRVDWDCDVLKNYADVNLGCGRCVSAGISWVFEQVEEAIILEDDCVPHPTFFRFCDELLERYRYDTRVMHIAGNNFQFGQKRTAYSYYFSHHNICWGWASWRRAWQYFDQRVRLWPMLRDTSFLLSIVGDRRAVEHWGKIFDRAHSGEVDSWTWDFQWTFACWAHYGLSILPDTTLVTNIGFDKDATHTKSSATPLAYMPSGAATFPLRHPPCVVRNVEADDFFVRQAISSFKPRAQGLRERVVETLSRFLPSAGWVHRATK